MEQYQVLHFSAHYTHLGFEFHLRKEYEVVMEVEVVVVVGMMAFALVRVGCFEQVRLALMV